MASCLQCLKTALHSMALSISTGRMQGATWLMLGGHPEHRSFLLGWLRCNVECLEDVAHLNSVTGGCAIQPLGPIIGCPYDHIVRLPGHQGLVVEGDVLCEQGEV